MKSPACCFANAHREWGGPGCEGGFLKEDKYYRDGTPRFICTRHWNLNRYGILRKARFVAVRDEEKGGEE